MYNRIDLSLKPSAMLAVSLIGFSLAMTAGLLHLARSNPWLGLTVIPLLALIGQAIRHQALLRGRNAVIRLQVYRDQLSVQCADGRKQTVRISPDSRLSGRIALLKVRDLASTKREYTVILTTLPGYRNVDSDDFRRLRVWLRFAGKDDHPISNHTPI